MRGSEGTEMRQGIGRGTSVASKVMPFPTAVGQLIPCVYVSHIFRERQP